MSLPLSLSVCVRAYLCRCFSDFNSTGCVRRNNNEGRRIKKKKKIQEETKEYIYVCICIKRTREISCALQSR